MRLSEELKIIPLFEPKDAAGAAYVSDAIDGALFHSLTFVIGFGTITGDATVLTVYCDATAALATALTTAIVFSYRTTAADYKTAGGQTAGSNADDFGDPTAVTVAASGITLVSATFSNRTIVIEIDCNRLGSTNHWLAVNTTASANPLLMCGFAIGRVRYPGHSGPSVL